MSAKDLDSATLARLRMLYPDFGIRVVRVLQDMKDQFGMPMRVTEGIRTFERQQELYDQGRTKPGDVVTNAKPGQSLHHYGCAADTCFVGADPYLKKHPNKTKIWTQFGVLAKAHGLVWGGDWDGDGDQEDQSLHDTPHLELRYGQTIAQMLELYKVSKLAGVWTKFDRVRGVPAEWIGPITKFRLMELGDLP